MTWPLIYSNPHYNLIGLCYIYSHYCILTVVYVLNICTPRKLHFLWLCDELLDLFTEQCGRRRCGVVMHAYCHWHIRPVFSWRCLTVPPTPHVPLVRHIELLLRKWPSLFFEKRRLRLWKSLFLTKGFRGGKRRNSRAPTICREPS